MEKKTKQNEFMFFTRDKFGTHTFAIHLSGPLSMWKVPFKCAMLKASIIDSALSKILKETVIKVLPSKVIILIGLLMKSINHLNLMNTTKCINANIHKSLIKTI